MSAVTIKRQEPTPAEVARITRRLTLAGDALRELMALLPEPTHRMAFELACSGAMHQPPAEDIAISAGMLARDGIRARAIRAPVLRLAGGAA